MILYSTIRKVFLLFLILTLILSQTSCNNQPKKTGYYASKTVLNKVNKEQQLKTDSLFAQQLLKKDYEGYINKPVQEFLATDGINLYKERIWQTGKPAYLTGLTIKFSDNFYIDIDVENYTYLKKRVNIDYNWDFSLFKKEPITRIRFNFKGKTIWTAGSLLPQQTIMY